MNSRKKLIVVGIVVIGALSYLLVTGLFSYSMHDAEVADILANPVQYEGKGVKVSGTVINGSINKAPNNLVFTMKDQDSDASIKVLYKGVVPDSFMDDATVILEGKYDSENKNFVASKLMAKCPSRYEGMDIEEHNKAIAEQQNADI